jgi:hypothetical protein
MFDVEVRGAAGKLTYRGDPPKYRVPPEAFVRLKPGETVRESVTIDPRSYRGFAAPGRYTLNFTYGYKGLWDEFAEKGGLTRVWRGSITGKGVPIEIRDSEAGTWVKSADGALALRLTARATEVTVGSPIEVVASLRNLTDKPVNVLRPGGDNYRARSSGIDLQGPKGAIRYTGDTPDYTLGATSFVTLEPGEAVSNHLSITVDDRRGSDRPGEYRVTFTYEADDGHRTTATKQLQLKDLWIGQIKSESVVVKKVEPKPAEGKKEPVRDRRVDGFVARLDRNGIKLAPTNDPNVWRVVEPNVAECEVSVRIVSFPAGASPEQVSVLRDKLGDLPTVEKIDERMAITGLRVRGPDEQESAPQTRETRQLESRILDLFRLYVPPNADTDNPPGNEN